MRSIEAMRMPPLVERRMTQYLHMREQPRSVSSRNMSASTACGVRIGAQAGMSASSTLATVGNTAPCSSGT